MGRKKPDVPDDREVTDGLHVVHDAGVVLSNTASAGRFFWVPEVPHAVRGYYATGRDAPNVTNDWRSAIRFPTRAECQAWCDTYNAAHPEVGRGKAFVPVEHGTVE